VKQCFRCKASRLNEKNGRAPIAFERQCMDGESCLSLDLVMELMTWVALVHQHMSQIPWFVIHGCMDIWVHERHARDLDEQSIEMHNINITNVPHTLSW